MENTHFLLRNNLTMLTDFYEITMANGFFVAGQGDKTVYFDMFFRTIPDDGGLAIMAGVEQVINYMKNLSFTEEDIAYLREKKLFDERFLEYLRHFKFKIHTIHALRTDLNWLLISAAYTIAINNP